MTCGEFRDVYGVPTAESRFPPEWAEHVQRCPACYAWLTSVEQAIGRQRGAEKAKERRDAELERERLERRAVMLAADDDE